MIEIARTCDPVKLSFLRAVLEEAGVDHVVLDDQMALLLNSAFGARLMVDEADAARARRLILAAEEAVELKPNDSNDLG